MESHLFLYMSRDAAFFKPYITLVDQIVRWDHRDSLAISQFVSYLPIDEPNGRVPYLEPNRPRGGQHL